MRSLENLPGVVVVLRPPRIPRQIFQAAAERISKKPQNFRGNTARWTEFQELSQKTNIKSDILLKKVIFFLKVKIQNLEAVSDKLLTLISLKKIKISLFKKNITFLRKISLLASLISGLFWHKTSISL